MTITLTGSDLTIEDLVKIARHNEKVEIHPEAIERMQACREMIEEKIAAREIMLESPPESANFLKHIYQRSKRGFSKGISSTTMPRELAIPLR
jgi:hypothetical protein